MTLTATQGSGVALLRGMRDLLALRMPPILTELETAYPLTLPDPASVYVGQMPDLVGDWPQVGVMVEASTLEAMVSPCYRADHTVVLTITAAEAISQYDLINIYLDGETLKGRLADGGTNQYVAHAFAIAAIENAATGVVQTNGIITGAGLTPGADYYLDDVPGDYCLAAAIPDADGEIVQKIGYAISTTQLVFEPEMEIELTVPA
jgi:hypothetical protein